MDMAVYESRHDEFTIEIDDVDFLVMCPGQHFVARGWPFGEFGHAVDQAVFEVYGDVLVDAAVFGVDEGAVDEAVAFLGLLGPWL